MKPFVAERFVRAHTHAGEHAMIAPPLGHRIAYDVGVVDDFPYTSIYAIPTDEQWLIVRHRAQAERIHSIFLPTFVYPAVVAELQADGYRIGAQEAEIVQLVR